MIAHALEKRRHTRVAIPVARTTGDTPPDSARIVNVSRSGACLWLDKPPRVDKLLALRLLCDGEDHVLRSRIVWSQLSSGASGGKHLPGARGWLTGLAFTECDLNMLPADVSPMLFRAGGAKLTLAFDDNDSGALEGERSPEDAGGGAVAVSEQSIPTVKAATRELLPIFARYFSDVRLVVTRERLEVSASFRSPTQESSADVAQREPRSLANRQLRDPVRKPMGMEPPDTPLPSPVEEKPRRRLWIAGSIAAAIVAAVLVSTISGKRTSIPAAVSVEPTVQGLPPVWAGDVGHASVAGWSGIQRQFKLPDSAVRSAIRVLRANDKYAPGQRLHDLTLYTDQVRRAFALMAGVLADSRRSVSLESLVTDLQARVVQGVRFPDEEPGGRYSSLQQELFNNIVVLTVVELFSRRRSDPDTQAALAGIRGDARALPTTAAARAG